MDFPHSSSKTDRPKVNIELATSEIRKRGISATVKLKDSQKMCIRTVVSTSLPAVSVRSIDGQSFSTVSLWIHMVNVKERHLAPLRSQNGLAE